MDMQKELSWWKSGIFYIVYTRSFKDTNGDGVGDLAGVIEKLDYLSDTLGVNAIWVAAIYPSPMKDFGYDVSNYTDVLPLFGDLPTMDHLIEEAHKRKLKVILDFIPNHCSDQHAWFLESRSSRDNPKRDWFMWTDPKGDRAPINNWLSVFGGSAWEWDEETQQFYMHSFLKEMPDLNWRNPEVKEAMFNEARFWLDRGVDGFRIDCAHHVMKDPQMKSNPPNPEPQDTAYKPLGEYDSQLHLYDREHPDCHIIWKDFRKLMNSYSDEQPRAAFGEIHIFEWTRWAEYYGGDALDELHMPFNLGLVGVEWDVKTIRSVVDGIEAAIPPGAWPNYMFNNFDESQAATRYGEAEARCAAMLLLTLRGTPTLCYGEEIGMVDVPIPKELEQDPFGIRVPGLGRDPYRTPMQWTSDPNAGFSDPDAPSLWLPLADNYKENNVEVELKDPASILNLYRRLIAYRQATPALFRGDYLPRDDVPGDCYVFVRQYEDERRLVALNFSGMDRNIRLPGFGKAKMAISTHMDREDQVDLADLELRGNEGVILEL